jgi:hypothetical protein
MKEPNLKFNWGAFFLPLHFGFATKAWLCFLALIPGINFIFCFVSGFAGAQWAYESGHFATVEEFNAVMDSWNRAGKFMLISTLISMAMVAIMFFGILAVMGVGIASVSDAINTTTTIL